MFTRIKLLLLAVVLTLAGGGLGALNLREHAMAKVTMKVVGEDGNPIEGADAGIFFERIAQQSTGGKGLTDANGELTMEGESDGKVSLGANKEGYYQTGEIKLIRNSQGNPEQKDGKWQPWNPGGIRGHTLAIDFWRK